MGDLSGECRCRGYLTYKAGNEILITQDIAGANLCRSEDDAEELLLRLDSKFGVNREDARIIPIANTKTASFTLGDGEFPNGISVEYSEQSKEYLMVVRDAGWENSHGLPEEVATLLSRFLMRLKEIKKSK